MSLSVHHTKLRRRAPTPIPTFHADDEEYSEMPSCASSSCVSVGLPAALPTAAAKGPSWEQPSKSLACDMSHVEVGSLSISRTPPNSDVETRSLGQFAPLLSSSCAWTTRLYRRQVSNVICNIKVIGPFYRKEVLIPEILTQDEMRGVICQNGIERVHGIWLDGKRLGKNAVELLLDNSLQSDKKFLVIISAAYPLLIRAEPSDGQHFGNFVADQAAYERYCAAMKAGKMRDMYQELKERFGIPQGY